MSRSVGALTRLMKPDHHRGDRESADDADDGQATADSHLVNTIFIQINILGVGAAEGCLRKTRLQENQYCNNEADDREG